MFHGESGNFWKGGEGTVTGKNKVVTLNPVENMFGEVHCVATKKEKKSM